MLYFNVPTQSWTAAGNILLYCVMPSYMYTKRQKYEEEKKKRTRVDK